LAGLVGVSVTDLSRIENGKPDFAPYPSGNLIRRLASALDADPDELLLTAEKIPDRVRKWVLERPDAFCAVAQLDNESLKRTASGPSPSGSSRQSSEGPTVAADTESLLAWHRCIEAIERLQARALAEVPHPEPRVRLLRTLRLLDVAEGLTLDRLHLGANILVTLGGGPAAISAFVDARCDELQAVREHTARVLNTSRQMEK
jgi:hypothetical protein